MAAGKVVGATSDYVFGNHSAMAKPVVQVFESLDECPEDMRGQLRTVRDAIDSELSGTAKKLIWGKKTIGLMSVAFTDQDERSVTIAAISGTGINEWTQKEVKFNNNKLKPLKQPLADKNITLADLTYEHEEYQKLREREAQLPAEEGKVIPPWHRKAFAKEFIMRFKRKVDGLKRAKLSRAKLLAALKKSPAYHPGLERDYEENLVPYYEQYINGMTLVEWCRQLIKQGTCYGNVIVFIEKVLTFVIPPPSSAEKAFTMLIEPIFRGFNIPFALAGFVCIAVSPSLEEYFDITGLNQLMWCGIYGDNDWSGPLDKAACFIEHAACCELIQHTRFKDAFRSVKRGVAASSIQEVIDELNTCEIPKEFHCLCSTALELYDKKDFKKELFPHYERVAGVLSVYEKTCNFLKRILDFDGDSKEFSRREIKKYADLWSTFLRIEKDLLKADPPPTDVQVVVDEYIKPYENVREEQLELFCNALGWRPDPRKPSLAELTVQCAEDNALAELKRCRQGRTVAEIKWVAVAMTEEGEPKYKPLCAFCQVAFPRRAKDVNNWPEQ